MFSLEKDVIFSPNDNTSSISHEVLSKMLQVTAETFSHSVTAVGFLNTFKRGKISYSIHLNCISTQD